ncbi:MAG: hypothetical protein ACYDB8_07970, partial [Acidiferrobacterales bacterium]
SYVMGKQCEASSGLALTTTGSARRSYSSRGALRGGSGVWSHPRYITETATRSNIMQSIVTMGTVNPVVTVPVSPYFS